MKPEVKRVEGLWCWPNAPGPGFQVPLVFTVVNQIGGRLSLENLLEVQKFRFYFTSTKTEFAFYKILKGYCMPFWF